MSSLLDDQICHNLFQTWFLANCKFNRKIHLWQNNIFVLFLEIQAVFRNPARKPQIPVEALGLSLPPRLTDQSSFWVRFKSNTKRKDYLNTVCDPSLYCMYVVFKEIKKSCLFQRSTTGWRKSCTSTLLMTQVHKLTHLWVLWKWQCFPQWEEKYVHQVNRISKTNMIEIGTF